LKLVRAEIRRITELALPVMAAQVGSMAMGTVDILMVGRVGVEALAAASVANAWIFATLLMGQGLMHGMDPLVSQAHGAGRGDHAALALQRSLLIVVVASFPLGVLWTNTANVLLWTGQDPVIAALAHEYTIVQIPTAWGFLVFVALRQYLLGREIMRPAMWVVGIANLVNFALNWVLIFGGLGIPALGLYGAGIATSITRVFLALGLWLWILRFRLHEGAWVPWSRAVFDRRELVFLLRLGVPVALQMSLEIWAFSAATLLAGRLGAVAVAAHAVALNLAALSFMLPLGISQGAVTRVGNLIGAGELERAQTAGWVSMALGAGVMSFSAVGFVLARTALPALYTSDGAVIAVCATILPIAGAFQIFDGTQVVGCGVLRGMGRTAPAAVFNFLAYWVLGLPVGAWLAFEGPRLGLAGIWWGLCMGLGVIAGLLIVWIAYRGPARAARELEAF